MALSGSQFLPVAQEGPDVNPRPFGLNAQLARQNPAGPVGLIARLTAGYILGGLPEADPVLYSRRSGAMPSAYAFLDLFQSTRAGKSSFFDALGLIQEANNNVPLFTYDPLTLRPRGLLSQKGTTNYCNSRCEGAAVGVVGSSNPGAFPSGMGFSAAGGLTIEIARIIPAGAGNIIEVRCSGIANSNNMRMYFASGAAAAQDDWFAGSMFMRAMQSGGVPGGTLRTRSNAVDVSGTPYALTRTWQRISGITQFTEADPVAGRMELRWSLVAGQAYDWVWQFYVPALEKAPFVSYCPLLPVAGAPTTPVTRIADQYQISDLSKIGFNGAAGTFLFRFGIDALAATTASADQLGLMRLVNTVTSEGIWATLVNNGRCEMTLFSATGSSIVVASPVGQLLPGAENTVAMSYSPERATLSVNGNPAVMLPATITMPNSMNLLRIGDLTTATIRKLNNPIALFNYYPTETAGADLQALSAAAFNM